MSECLFHTHIMAHRYCSMTKASCQNWNLKICVQVETEYLAFLHRTVHFWNHFHNLGSLNITSKVAKFCRCHYPIWQMTCKDGKWKHKEGGLNLSWCAGVFAGLPTIIVLPPSHPLHHPRASKAPSVKQAHLIWNSSGRTSPSSDYNAGGQAPDCKLEFILFQY